MGRPTSRRLRVRVTVLLAVEKVLTTASGPASAPPEPIPAAPLPPIPVASSLQSRGPDVPATPAIQAGLNSIAAEASPVAEAPVLQPEQGIEPPLPAGSVGQSWLRKHKARPAVAVSVCVALFAIAVARLTRKLPQPD